jgi:tRNA nucleotidyltransferase (CCA-adding enzyme)
LVFDAGEDVENLDALQADITTKNPSKFKNHHNFIIVRKIVEVEERDHVRKFQPPISGKNYGTI